MKTTSMKLLIYLYMAVSISQMNDKHHVIIVANENIRSEDTYPNTSVNHTRLK